MYEVQRAVEELRQKVELVPVIQFPPGVDSGVPTLSIANAGHNGCRVYEVELEMERTARDKESARKMAQLCLVWGSGVIPPFQKIEVDLHKPVEALFLPLYRGTGGTCWPDVRMRARIRYLASGKNQDAFIPVYTAQWYHREGKVLDGIRGLKLADG